MECDLCSDTGPLSLRAACHPTAPLRVELDGNGTMILFCYVPQCNREVARFQSLTNEFVPDEFTCPNCGGRARQFYEGDPSSAICPRDGTAMLPMTWRAAAEEAGAIAQRHKARAEQIEAAWPDGYQMPVEDEP